MKLLQYNENSGSAFSLLISR